MNRSHIALFACTVAACGGAPSINSARRSAAAVAADPTFTSQILRTINTPVVELALTDLNLDGKLDVVLLHVQPSANFEVTACMDIVVGALPFPAMGCKVATLLGDGRGGFTAREQFDCGTIAREDTTRSGGCFTALRTGDFNGDGRPDVAVLESRKRSESPVHLLLGDGSGRFSRQGLYSMPINTTDLAAADFNGDGLVDLAGVTYDRSLPGTIASTMRGRSDGSLDAPVPRFASIVGRLDRDGRYLRIVSADVDGDGRTDLALSAATVNGAGGPGRLAYYAGSGDGAGGFGAFRQIGSGDSVYDSSLSGGDLNGDGVADLLEARDGRGWLSGPGALASQVKTGPGGAFGFLADLNGDGLADFVRVSTGLPGGAGLAVGDGTGGLRDLATPIVSGASAFAVGDVNGDGRPDVVIGTQDGSAQLQVLLGR